MTANITTEADRKAAIDSLANIANSITAVYSGRLGCACGCRGNHTSSERSKRIILKRIKQAALDGYTVHFASFGAWVDTDTRAYVAYTDGRIS